MPFRALLAAGDPDVLVLPKVSTKAQPHLKTWSSGRQTAR